MNTYSGVTFLEEAEEDVFTEVEWADIPNYKEIRFAVDQGSH